MTIIITVPADLATAMRLLMPLVEPVVLAIAGACGAGFLVQLCLDLGLRLAQRALTA
jgi:hypothetical protein